VQPLGSYPLAPDIRVCTALRIIAVVDTITKASPKTPEACGLQSSSAAPSHTVREPIWSSQCGTLGFPSLQILMSITPRRSVESRAARAWTQAVTKCCMSAGNGERHSFRWHELRQLLAKDYGPESGVPWKNVWPERHDSQCLCSAPTEAKANSCACLCSGAQSKARYFALTCCQLISTREDPCLSSFKKPGTWTDGTA